MMVMVRVVMVMMIYINYHYNHAEPIFRFQPMLVNFEISSNPTLVSRPATATNHPRSGFRSFPLKLSQKSNQPFKIFQIQFQPFSLHLGLLLLLLLLLRLLFLLCGRLLCALPPQCVKTWSQINSIQSLVCILVIVKPVKNVESVKNRTVLVSSCAHAHLNRELQTWFCFESLLRAANVDGWY